MTTEAGTTTVTTSYALSKEGPHHVELGQSIEGTLWTTPTPGHAHHVGYWVDDVVAASRALDQGGSPRVATIAISDDAAPMCAYKRTTSGLFVEVVRRGLRRVLLPEERALPPHTNSKERRVRKEGVSTGRRRWGAEHKKQ